jgi:mono/diheme cytochrome c family protein
VVVLALAGVAVYVSVGERSGGGPTVDVRVPELSSVAQRGARAFEASCARCHGAYAGGTAAGPPLVHKIYEPSHHGDSAIRRAARFGVRPHHWRFGPMPKVDVSDRQLEGIVAFVRELQRANGIR